MTPCDNADYSDYDESFELSIELNSTVATRVAPGERASTRVTIRDDDHTHGVSPGIPELTPVEDGELAPTTTSMSFTVSCVTPGAAPVTDYILLAENTADLSEGYTQSFPGPPQACSTITATMDGLPSRTEATTYRVRAYARNLFARRSPLSDWVELATLGVGGQVVGNSAGTIGPVGVVRAPHASDPVVTVTAISAVTEGASAHFTLNTNSAPIADLGVTVTIAQSGQFVDASAIGSRTVTIPSGATSASFTIATIDDQVEGPDKSDTRQRYWLHGWKPRKRHRDSHRRRRSVTSDRSQSRPRARSGRGNR